MNELREVWSTVTNQRWHFRVVLLVGQGRLRRLSSSQNRNSRLPLVLSFWGLCGGVLYGGCDVDDWFWSGVNLQTQLVIQKRTTSINHNNMISPTLLHHFLHLLSLQTNHLSYKKNSIITQQPLILLRKYPHSIHPFIKPPTPCPIFIMGKTDLNCPVSRSSPSHHKSPSHPTTHPSWRRWYPIWGLWGFCGWWWWRCRSAQMDWAPLPHTPNLVVG